ncbi:MAG: hypothetical protein LBM95_01215 [Lactobacillales bacterium]|jgi:hypothetical protein|nr:hypothetical protein [Lactobacillales bacterium]
MKFTKNINSKYFYLFLFLSLAIYSIAYTHSTTVMSQLIDTSLNISGTDTIKTFEAIKSTFNNFFIQFSFRTINAVVTIFLIKHFFSLLIRVENIFRKKNKSILDKKVNEQVAYRLFCVSIINYAILSVIMFVTHKELTLISTNFVVVLALIVGVIKFFYAMYPYTEKIKAFLPIFLFCIYEILMIGSVLLGE